MQGVVSLSAPRLFGRVEHARGRTDASPSRCLRAAVEDETVQRLDAQRHFAATAITDKRVEIFPGSDHGTPMLRDPAVRQLVDGWIAA